MKLFLFSLCAVLFFFTCPAISGAVAHSKKDESLSSKWNAEGESTEPPIHVLERIDFLTVSNQENVPFFQYFASFGVTIPILFMANFWKYREQIMTQIILAFDAYLMFLSLPAYFGYLPCFDPHILHGDIISPRIPFFKLRPFKFPQSKTVISIVQWRFVFFFWILEILVLLPGEYFKPIEKNSGIQIRLLLEHAFILSTFYVFGLVSIFNSFMDKLLDFFENRAKRNNSKVITEQPKSSNKLF